MFYILPISLFKEWIPDVVLPKLPAAQWDTKVKVHYSKWSPRSESESRAQFLDILKGWDLFGSSFFDIKASNDPRFSSGGLLCVDGVGIRVLDWNTRVSRGGGGSRTVLFLVLSPFRSNLRLTTSISFLAFFLSLRVLYSPRETRKLGCFTTCLPN